MKLTVSSRAEFRSPLHLGGGDVDAERPPGAFNRNVNWILVEPGGSELSFQEASDMAMTHSAIAAPGRARMAIVCDCDQSLHTPRMRILACGRTAAKGERQLSPVQEVAQGLPHVPGTNLGSTLLVGRRPSVRDLGTVSDIARERMWGNEDSSASTIGLQIRTRRTGTGA